MLKSRVSGAAAGVQQLGTTAAQYDNTFVPSQPLSRKKAPQAGSSNEQELRVVIQRIEIQVPAPELEADGNFVISPNRPVPTDI